jgi:hypothetical protein
LHRTLSGIILVGVYDLNEWVEMDINGDSDARQRPAVHIYGKYSTQKTFQKMLQLEARAGNWALGAVVY